MPNTYYVTYGNSILTAGAAGSAISITSVDPYNPLGLPPYTIRVKYLPGYSPADSIGDTRTLVDSTENIWDITKNSTDWHGLFLYQASPVRAVLGANTTGVTAMYSMFDGCSNLLSAEIFDTSAVTSFYRMFNGCSGLTHLPTYPTQSASVFSAMFMGCTALQEIPPISTAGARYMGDMFRNCESITSLPANFDTSSVVDFNGTFAGCENLVSASMVDTSSAQDCWSMFFRCEKLTTLPTLNLANCWRMKLMFGSCFVLENVDIRNTGLVTDWEEAFSSCRKLKHIPAQLDTSSATNVNYTFYYCEEVESGALALYQQLSTQATPPSNHTKTFGYCGSQTVTGAAELAQIPSSWGGTAA